jgi:hypothetical protein
MSSNNCSVDIAEKEYDLAQQNALSEYEGLPDVDWHDILEVLDDDLVNVVSESLGADSCNEKEWADQWTLHCEKVFGHIANGGSSDAELGKMVRELATPYIIKCAQRRLEIRGDVKSNIEDIKKALEVK